MHSNFSEGCPIVYSTSCMGRSERDVREESITSRRHVVRQLCSNKL